MELTQLMRRAAIVALVVGASAASTVFYLHDVFHSVFRPAALSDAIGTLIIVFATVIGQYLVSAAFYRDTMLGMDHANRKSKVEHDCYSRTINEVEGELQQVGRYNEVVRGQLRGVIEETEAAAFGIVDRLQHIDDVISKLDRFVSSSAEESARLVEDSEARIARNQTILGRMEGYVQQRLREAREDKERVSQVVLEAHSLESLVQLIKRVAEQINLLALNAAIEAARAGEAGRGFAVVADEVRKLSGETERAVLKISQGISSVASNIKLQFEDKLSNINLENEKQLLDFFSTQLKELGRSYEDMMRHDAAVLNEVHQSSSELSAMFMEAHANIQFQDVTRQQLEHVIQALSQLDKHILNLLSRIENPYSSIEFQPLAEQLESLYARYVMERQRTVHDKSLKRDAAPAAPIGARVELF